MPEQQRWNGLWKKLKLFEYELKSQVNGKQQKVRDTKRSEIKFGILEFKFNGRSDILKSIFSHTKWTSGLSHRHDDQLREMAQLTDIQSKDFLWESFVLSHGIILLPLEKPSECTKIFLWRLSTALLLRRWEGQMRGRGLLSLSLGWATLVLVYYPYYAFFLRYVFVVVCLFFST